ncbi:MAG: RDD family protein [Elusimicrobiaceae bacterium]|nr:RDD family protein [Elusimicrobiaceae bacterium]
MQKPSFWRLFGAYVIDFFILIAAQGIYMCIIIDSTMRGSYHWHDSNGIGHTTWDEPIFPWLASFLEHVPFVVLYFLIPLLIGYCYFVISESLKGKTFGKKIFRLKSLYFDGQQASWCRILVAYFIDLFLSFGICAILLLLWRCIPIQLVFRIRLLLIPLLLSWIVFPSLYFSICESRWGKTLGKKLMGLQVVQDVPANKNE